MHWPDNKDFAFTIIDDTDEATVANVKPVYDFLYEVGTITTKTVWAFPPRDPFNGETLSDENYRCFIRELAGRGYEIAFHGAGSGDFNREEILSALDLFKEYVGYYPRIHINHAFNSHNLYWEDRRFTFPIGALYGFIKQICNIKSVASLGETEGCASFWGDIAKQNIKYIRNRVFTGINTISYDKHMPYIEKGKEKYSNYWFSSSDGYDCNKFVQLVSHKNIDKLERQRGCAIIYTHFAYGFVKENGALDEEFKKNMAYLAGKRGWFVPAGEMLDYLNSNGNEFISNWQSLMLDLKWLGERIARKIIWRV